MLNCYYNETYDGAHVLLKEEFELYQMMFSDAELVEAGVQGSVGRETLLDQIFEQEGGMMMESRDVGIPSELEMMSNPPSSAGSVDGASVPASVDRLDIDSVDGASLPASVDRLDIGSDGGSRRGSVALSAPMSAQRLIVDAESDVVERPGVGVGGTGSVSEGLQRRVARASYPGSGITQRTPRPDFADDPDSYSDDSSTTWTLPRSGRGGFTESRPFSGDQDLPYASHQQRLLAGKGGGGGSGGKPRSPPTRSTHAGNNDKNSTRQYGSGISHPV